MGLASEAFADGGADSFALAAAQMGHELMIAHPQGYELDDELMATHAQSAEAGGSVEVTNDIDAAFDGAEVIYAQRVGVAVNFMERRNGNIAHRAQFRDRWIVNEPKMARTDCAIFMHCLPVRRNVIVTDGVIDSPASVVIDEAENRLHVQKAIMASLLG